MIRVLSIFVLLGALCGPVEAATHLMRYADVHGDQIVFTYEDDLWLVSTEGGLARRITSHPGVERLAKFSPDGRWIAFTGQYDGGTDVYVMNAMGGVPRRLSFHPSTERVVDWYPDGSAVLFRARRTYPTDEEHLYRIGLEGGMPEKLPIDRGGLASFDATATRIAYNRISREAATWKRYQGGMAQDIWLADLQGGAFKRMTDWVGTDNYPMFHEDTIYFTSDRAHGTLNLFGIDTASGELRQLTDYRDYDVKYPSMGDGVIVYQYAEQLHLIDVRSGEARYVPVEVRSDRVHVRTDWVSVEPRTGSFGLSPDAERLLLEARGELLDVPVEKGDARQLTRDSASREKSATWSPDGEWIAFLSDRSGDEELYVMPAHGRGPWRQLTDGGEGFKLPAVWSPDSKWLVFSDKALRLNLIDVGSGKLHSIDRGPVDDAWERWGIQDYVWSPDSRWIAYSKMGENMRESIFLYSIETEQSTALTDSMTTDWSPSFDPEGRYLYFLSARSFQPIMGLQDQNHVFVDVCRPYLLLLQDDLRSPFRPDAGDTAAEDGDATGEDTEDDPPMVKIDLQGIEHRVLAVDGVERGNYFRLEATAEGFLVLRKNELEFLKYQNVNDHTTDELELLGYDLDETELASLMDGIANYHLSADGKKLVYRAGNRYGIVDVGKEGKVGDGAIDLSDVRLAVDRQAEFLQMFDEAWRIQRDWFYDPGMHGVDWESTRQKYVPFVADCGVRGDLNYLIGEMIAELNIGHTYVFGGDYEDGGARVSTGLLGCDFDLPEGAEFYRISRIVVGVPWDESERSPLAEPGSPVREGQYLIAIDEAPVRAGDNVFAHLQDAAGEWVTLTLNDRPREEGAFTWQVKTLRGEYGLRYRDWVESNREKVAQWSDGRIGYLHLPDMMQPGLIEFARYWYPQLGAEAMILDDRYNNGGFVGDMIIDRLERQLWGVTVPREGARLPANPENAFHGPVVVLINEDTGSNGEYFATAIQLKGLATVMGMRTWGGAVGIEPHQDLVDGGVTTPPQFGLYGLAGDWMIEGIGVDPDVEVFNDPASVVAGDDPQLRAAVDHLLRQIREETDRWRIPATPPFPDKSKAEERAKTR